ncbi:hypothetical protein XH94_23705 [Bradyrhizobium zhanjiangense]|uniref:Uncharacterized protein n=1 Tax=Bradyrhizobium zhanjiangense TaxID=1325107 RepID=A0A4Q0SJT1_9BRAD|nr:hypothetical protein XH94_23705 [Bradyrhizobium zhanjiangense]
MILRDEAAFADQTAADPSVPARFQSENLRLGPMWSMPGAFDQYQPILKQRPNQPASAIRAAMLMYF